MNRPRKRPAPPRPPTAVQRALNDSTATSDLELLSALREHPSFPGVVAMLDARIGRQQSTVRTLDTYAAGLNTTAAYESLRKERDHLCALTLLRCTLCPHPRADAVTPTKEGN